MNISEAVKATGLSIDTIRYYEKIGLVKPIPRTSGGIRKFDEKSIRQLTYAKLMRRAGFPIEELQSYMKLAIEDDPDTLKQRKELLATEQKKITKQIEELQETLAYLTSKITNYDEVIAGIEHELSEG